MKKYLSLFVAVVAVLLFFYNNKKVESVSGVTPVSVSAITATAKPLLYKYNTVGTVAPLQEVVVQPQISGKLEDVLFNEGDMVTEGAVLAKIDDAQPQAELERAQAELAVNQAKLQEAENNLKRYKQLRKVSVVSQKALEEYESAYKQLQAMVESGKAQVKSAQINYDHTKIAAPISGRIGLRKVDKGNIVSMSDNAEIATIVQMSPISVIFSIPQNLVPVLAHNNNTVVEICDNASGKIIAKGKVAALDNAINKQNGTLQIRAEFDNSDEKLWVGQFVNVSVIYGQNKHNVVLPNKVVRSGVNGSYVFKFSDGKALVALVETGYGDENNVVIESGIKEGDIIITDGFSALTNGMSVKVAEEK